jgi:7-cyano-7-deazaguanine synthase in queuosine biosynthesis
LKAVLLNSGGLDSLLAGDQMLRDHGDAGWEFISLHIRDKRSDHAAKAAQESARILGLEHVELKAEVMWDFWVENKYGFLVLPLNQLHLFCVGWSWALKNDAAVIYSGLKPDLNSQEWMGALKTVLYSGGAKENRKEGLPWPLIHFPLEGWNTSMEAVVAEATARGLPLGHTVSCQRSPADGTCGRCQSRSRLGLRVQ